VIVIHIAIPLIPIATFIAIAFLIATLLIQIATPTATASHIAIPLIPIATFIAIAFLIAISLIQIVLALYTKTPLFTPIPLLIATLPIKIA